MKLWERVSSSFRFSSNQSFCRAMIDQKVHYCSTIWVLVIFVASWSVLFANPVLHRRWSILKFIKTPHSYSPCFWVLKPFRSIAWMYPTHFQHCYWSEWCFWSQRWSHWLLEAILIGILTIGTLLCLTSPTSISPEGSNRFGVKWHMHDLNESFMLIILFFVFEKRYPVEKLLTNWKRQLT